MAQLYNLLLHFKNRYMSSLLRHLPLPSPETPSILFLCSQAHILAGCRLETQLTSTVLRATRLTKFVNFKSLKVHYIFRPVWPSSGVKNL
jgi:hypothetical protein